MIAIITTPLWIDAVVLSSMEIVKDTVQLCVNHTIQRLELVTMARIVFMLTDIMNYCSTLQSIKRRCVNILKMESIAQLESIAAMLMINL